MHVNFLTSGSTKESQQNIIYESQRFVSYVKEVLVEESQIERGDRIFSLFTKNKGRHILGRGISCGALLKKCPIVKSDDLSQFIKRLTSERCDYLFCTPSFLWNIRQYIDLTRIKKIQLAGEYVSRSLAHRFLALTDPHQLLINHYGTSETFGIGYGRLGDDFKLIPNGKIVTHESDFYFKSPYTRSTNMELLSDILLIRRSGFAILGRNNLNFIKKNGKKINLLNLRDSLFQLPIVDMNFKHDIDNYDFECFDLYLIGDEASEFDIRKHIDRYFDGNYQPRNVIFLKAFDKTKNNIKFKLF